MRLALVSTLAFLSATSLVFAADPLPAADPGSLGFSVEGLSRIGSFLQNDIAEGRLPGAVIAISRRGKLAYFESFGFRDKAGGVPMTRDTLFSLASMSKALTIVGALRLMDEGKLFLDEPVDKHLPPLRQMQVGKVGPDGAIERVPVIRPMTIRDLMRHSSGLTYPSDGPVQKLYQSVGFGSIVPAAEFIERLAALPLAKQPGTEWEYGLSIDVLGLVVEKISGLPLGRYLSETLFEPLGMTETGFSWSAEKAQRHAKPFPINPSTGRPQSVFDPSKALMECGGVCITSTAGDYLRFAQMLSGKGRLEGTRVLSRAAVELMTSDHHGAEIKGFPNVGYSYGLGVAVRKSEVDAEFMGSPQRYFWVGFSGTSFWVEPKEELVVVFMAHAPGMFRRYHQTINALVLGAIED